MVGKDLLKAGMKAGAFSASLSDEAQQHFAIERGQGQQRGEDKTEEPGVAQQTDCLIGAEIVEVCNCSHSASRHAQSNVSTKSTLARGGKVRAHTRVLAALKTISMRQRNR